MSTTDFSTQRDELLAERDHLLTQLGHMGRAPGTSELEFDEGFADSGQVTAERGEVDALAVLCELLPPRVDTRRKTAIAKRISSESSRQKPPR